ncbi:MAG: Murein DD-endopeptidase MepM and murein hydrolase activator NlpD, containing LysM domain [Klenkia sp.]|nr:Murein DD-endopeptidase MepM and murein hydrolase activator NlpD, containing LysM domain [Klenkia sp.]
MKPQHPQRLLGHDLEPRNGAAGTADRGSVAVEGSQGTVTAGGAGTAFPTTSHTLDGHADGAVVSVLVSAAAAPERDALVRDLAGRVAATLDAEIPARDAVVIDRAAARDGDLVVADSPREDVEVSAAEIIAAIAEGRVARGRHRQVRGPRTRALVGPARMRRPTLYLAAALVGATGIGLLTTGDPQAQADQPRTATASEVVSVAAALGLPAAPSTASVESDAVGQLQQMAASRAQRETEQAAAAQTQAAADQAVLDAQAAAAAEAARPTAVAPVDGARLSSQFGYRWGTLHAGIDLAAPMLTPEYAVMDGVVLQAGPASGFGQAVYIQHENGDVTVYGHMEEILVSAGQVVQAGETIALLGNQGQSTGPHLHLEVHVGGMNGEKIDPVPWLAERGVTL